MKTNLVSRSDCGTTDGDDNLWWAVAKGNKFLNFVQKRSLGVQTDPNFEVGSINSPGTVKGVP